MTRATRSSLSSKVLGSQDSVKGNSKEITKPDLVKHGISKKFLNQKEDSPEDKENRSNNEQKTKKRNEKDNDFSSKSTSNAEKLSVSTKDLSTQVAPIKEGTKPPGSINKESKNFLDMSDDQPCNLIDIFEKNKQNKEPQEKDAAQMKDKLAQDFIQFQDNPSAPLADHPQPLPHPVQQETNSSSKPSSQDMNRSSSNPMSEEFIDSTIENSFNKFSDSFAKILQEFFPVVSENYDMMIASNRDLQLLVEMTENNIDQVENRRQHVLGYIESLRLVFFLYIFFFS